MVDNQTAEDEKLEQLKKTLEKEENANSSQASGKLNLASAVGRRKEAIARVTIKPGAGNWNINNLELDKYFPNKVHQQIVIAPLKAVGNLGSYDITVNVNGGGLSGQAGAVRLGIARSLNAADKDFNRAILKKAGFLTRDARVVERKKAGLKKARKAPQFSKR
ncbi:MAG: 30S ribosomal protein S9 [Bifidobacteriaceae bacterium]|jgi:small subunit ribosomal protein S9|nr:30S ribosomal protein S9 [Bifidobacteriaceae bacterium]